MNKKCVRHKFEVTIRTFPPLGATKYCLCGLYSWKAGEVTRSLEDHLLVRGEIFVTKAELLDCPEPPTYIDKPLPGYPVEQATKEVQDALMEDEPAADLTSMIKSLDDDSIKVMSMEIKLERFKTGPFMAKNFVSVGNGTTDAEVAANIANNILRNIVEDLDEEV